MSAENADVLVIGAGPVGLLIALRLGQAGIRTVVVEKEPAISDLPRAVGYFAAAQIALHKANVYDKIRSEGFMSPGISWRKATMADSQGFRKLGEVIARMGLRSNDESGYPIGDGLLNLPQAALSRLILREVLAVSQTTVHFNQELTSIEDNGNSVAATTKSSKDGKERRFMARYLVGADGARSQVRSFLNIRFPGHTWPDKLLTTDVVTKNYEEVEFPTQYILDPIHYVVMTPLEKPILGESTKWRVVIGLAPDDNRPDDVVRSPEVIHAFYDKILPGPRPLDVKITRSSVFRLHQRLAATLRLGRCVLAGDAAHLCNPIGALGLNTGILDADALAETLIMILNESRSDRLLDVYNDERRKVFQRLVDPLSTYNKLRLYSVDADTACRDDWFFRLMQNPSPELSAEMNKPFFEMWPTDIRALAKQLNL